jgi:ABC-type uncharacterized transport system ATPase subunit
MIPHVNRKQYTKNIGVVFGQRTQLWWNLAVIESFELLKTIYRIPTESYKKNLKIFFPAVGTTKAIFPVNAVIPGSCSRIPGASAARYRLKDSVFLIDVGTDAGV